MSTSFDAYAKQAEHELGDQAADAYKIVNQMLRGMRFHPSQLIDAPADSESEQPVVLRQVTADAQQHETEAVRLATDDQVERQVKNTPAVAKKAIAQQAKALSPDAEAMIKQEEQRKHATVEFPSSEAASDQTDAVEDDLDLDDYIHRYLEDPASDSSSTGNTASTATAVKVDATTSDTQMAAKPADEPQTVDDAKLVRDQSMTAPASDSATAVAASDSSEGHKQMTLSEAIANSRRLQRAAAEESQSEINAEDAAAQAVVDDQPEADDIPVDPQSQPHSQTQIQLPPMRGHQVPPVKTDYDVNPDVLKSAADDDDDDDVPVDVLDDDDSQKSLAELQNNPIIAKKSPMKNTVLVGAVIGIIILAILAVAFL